MYILNNNLYCDTYDCSIKMDKNQFLYDVSVKVNNRYKVFKLETEGDDEKSVFYFNSSHVVEPVSFSGKAIELLIGIDKFCVIHDIKLLKHSEPIILIGIPLNDLLNAVASYKNKSIKNSLYLGSTKTIKEGFFPLNKVIDVISSATVTSMALHSTVLESVSKVASDFYFIQKKINSEIFNSSYVKYDTWDDLVRNGFINHYKKYDTNGEVILDLYYADITHPTIGLNLFGEYGYKYLFSLLNENDSIICIMNAGTWSFKGSGWVRGGLFDRFHVTQQGKTFLFHDYDYQTLPNFVCSDVPYFKEGGLFILRNQSYNPACDWGLVFLYGSSFIGNMNKDFSTIITKYKVPMSLVEKQVSLYVNNLINNLFSLVFYVFFWLFISFIFIFKRKFFSFRKEFFELLYLCILIVSVFFFGCICNTQPSVVNIFTICDVFMNGVTIKLFLLDPFFTVGWFFLLVTTVLWGRAFFCGWVCPFGCVQELLFRMKEFFFNNIISIEFSSKFRFLFQYTRFVLFFLLIILSSVSFNKAEIFAEIEPFKTMWNIGIFNRNLYGLYTIFLLVISFFMYRFFCRFLCPLGGFISLLSKISIFKLKRRHTCAYCAICRLGCKSEAISRNGGINSLMCIGCFDCVVIMDNAKVCPELIKKNVSFLFYEKK